MKSTSLVPVFTGQLQDQTTQLCNARDLHATLESGQEFANWIKNRIEQYGFTEGEDYLIKLSNRSDGRGGKRRTDYHLTLDMAKELAMVENNDKGRMVRRYFIEVEKKARKPQPALPATVLDKDTQARINRHAWSLAQSTFERFRRELTQDVESKWFRGTIEEWKPKEYRNEFVEALEANAAICRTFADSIQRGAKKLADMGGVDYEAVASKFWPKEAH